MEPWWLKLVTTVQGWAKLSLPAKMTGTEAKSLRNSVQYRGIHVFPTNKGLGNRCSYFKV